MTQVQLAIFARAPVAGQCKTRLIPALGAEGAAALHAQLVERTVKVAMSVAHAEVTLWTEGKADHPFFQYLACAYPVLQWRQQPEGDLGERMHQVFVAHQQPTLLMGSDCPVFTSALLTEYAALLQQHDAVIVPAEDGGYVLVGLQTPCVEIFRCVDWGSDRVMDQTRQRLCQLALRWIEPEMLWDIDRPEDMQRWADMR